MEACPKRTYIGTGNTCIDCVSYCKECNGKTCNICETGKFIFELGSKLVNGSCYPLREFASSLRLAAILACALLAYLLLL